MRFLKFNFLFATLVLIGAMACKQQAIVVNPGAVVSKDGTDDGLSDIQHEFKDATRTTEGVKFTLSSDLLFPTNSSYLTQKAMSELDKLSSLLKGNTKQIRVDGHTDATGTANYNQWLSEKRAASVKKYLEDAGIASNRIITQGLGQEKPIADNKTPEGRQLNRRVEVTVLD